MQLFINGQHKTVTDIVPGGGHEDQSAVGGSIESQFVNDSKYCDSSQLQPASEGSVSRCKRYMELERLCHFVVKDNEEAFLGIPKKDRTAFSPAYAPFKPENLSTWQEAADLGISNGCYLLGQCLLNGGEIEEGLRWLKTAISKGNYQAKRTLGEYLLDNGKTDAGLKLLNEVVDSGDAYACDILASRYQNGEGVSKSRSKFRYYLERAALRGSHYAQHCLAADNLTSGWGWW